MFSNSISLGNTSYSFPSKLILNTLLLKFVVFKKWSNVLFLTLKLIFLSISPYNIPGTNPSDLSLFSSDLVFVDLTTASIVLFSELMIGRFLQ